MNKNTIGGAVILVIALVLGIFFATRTPASQQLGDVYQNQGDFPNCAKLGARVTCWSTVSIGQSANQGFIRNTTGGKIYVDLAEIIPTATTSLATAVASSTFKFYVGTSTTASISNDFSAPYATLIDGQQIATSTASNNTIRVLNSIKNASTTGNTVQSTNEKGVIEVADGLYVFFTWQSMSAGCTQTAICDAATSTNRGFNAIGNLRYHY